MWRRDVAVRMHAWLYLPADKSMAAPGTAKVPVVIMAHGYGLDKVRASRGRRLQPRLTPQLG